MGHAVKATQFIEHQSSKQLIPNKTTSIQIIPKREQ